MSRARSRGTDNTTRPPLAPGRVYYGDGMETPARFRHGGIAHGSFDDGPGSRTVLWFAGCPLACPGCINRQLWPADSGEAIPVGTAVQRLLDGRALGDHGVTFLGGEPTAQPDALAALCEAVAAEWPATRGYPRVIVYSGYTYEALRDRRHPSVDRALALADVLVDGPYVAARAHPDLGFRGSANQRVIDLPATAAAGRVVTLDWDSPRIHIIRGRVVASAGVARRLGLPVTAARECGEHRV